MPIEPLENYALNFDLFQDELIKKGFKNPAIAYKKIKKGLATLGYKKRQQSSFFQKKKQIYQKFILI